MSQYIVCAVQICCAETSKKCVSHCSMQCKITWVPCYSHRNVNGTISGPREGIDALLPISIVIRAKPDFRKESLHNEQPFYRTKVKLKRK